MAFLTPEKLLEAEEVFKNLPVQEIPQTRTLTEAVLTFKPLTAYPLPVKNTRRGMHGTAEADRPFGSNPMAIIDFLWAAGFTWITILMNPGGDNLGIVDYALAKGFGVNNRLYRSKPNPGGLTGEQKAMLQRVAPRYRNKPVYWIFNNEPDLPDEWSTPMPSDWLAVVARNAIADCRFIQGLGLIPVLPAAATGSPGFYQYRLVPMMLSLGGGDVFEGLIVFGVHNYCVGHPIGGIRFEDLPYPYDSVNQNGRALVPNEFTSFGDVWNAWGTDQPANVNNERARNKNVNQKHTDLGGASGNIALWHQIDLNLRATGLLGIPVISTEGGEYVNVRNDGRYPRTNAALRVERQLEIARRAANKSSLTAYNYPTYVLNEGGDWLLEDDRAGSPWKGGGYFSFGVVRPEYVDYFNAHATIVRHVPVTNVPPTNPPTTPPTNPPTVPPTNPPTNPPVTQLPPRVLIDIPDFLTITEAANVQPGEKFWRAVKVERKRAETSGGLHHIYHEQPHDATVTMKVYVHATRETFPIPHSKPASEPAANFNMNANGNLYDSWVEGKGVTKSDRIGKMQMYQGQHESFHIWWELATMPTVPTPPTEYPPVAALKTAGRAAQEITPNYDSALQKAARDEGFIAPLADEKEITIAGVTWVYQLFYDPYDKEEAVFFCVKFKWGEIWMEKYP